MCSAHLSEHNYQLHWHFQNHIDVSEGGAQECQDCTAVLYSIAWHATARMTVKHDFLQHSSLLRHERKLTVHTCWETVHAVLVSHHHHSQPLSRLSHVYAHVLLAQ